LIDVENNEVVRTEETPPRLCAPDSPSLSGPCSLTVQFYDGHDLSLPPFDEEYPMAHESLRMDTCGRFQVTGIQGLSAGTLALAIAVDDAGVETRVQTRTFVDVAAGTEMLQDVTAYATRHETDQAWTDSAGNPLEDMTFSQHGAILGVFVSEGAPTAGVKITDPPGGVEAASDFYFSDATASTRSTIDSTLDATGTNGSALFVDLFFGTISGEGEEPIGCEWSSGVTAAREGVIAVRQLQLVNSQTGEPCSP